MMWALIFLFTILAFVAGCVYLVSRVRRFSFVDKIAKGRKKIGIAVSAGVCILMIGILVLCMDFTNAVICILYLLLFWLISDLVFFIIKKIRKKDWKRYYAGMAAVLITCLYMVFGWYQAHGVWEQDYVIHTDKQVGTIRAVLIADSHTGTTFDGDGFAEHMKAVQAQNPDVVLVAGDFVDDDTSLSDMQKCCAALGALDTKYGVYYVFGNHDKGYYAADYRGYDGDDLVAELTKNGVHVLQDENVLIDDRFYIIGRQDLSEETDRGGSRADMSELTADLDDTKYQIVLDHQPADYDAEAASGVDLVLSGHTHGGQLFLIRLFEELTGVGGNDQIYGIEKENTTDFLVTSGISDWAIKFKTGCRSEFVVIDIEGK